MHRVAICRGRSAVPHDPSRPTNGPSVVPCQAPASGIRHLFDLVSALAAFNRRSTTRPRDHRFIEGKQAIMSYDHHLNAVFEKPISNSLDEVR